MQTKRNIKTFFSALILILSIQSSSAQESKLLRQTLSSGGSSILCNLNGKSKLVQQSIGQASVIGTHTAQKQIVRQGFIQPKTSTHRLEVPVELDAIVYPNPFSQSINVQFNETLEGTAQISVYDLSGRLVEVDQMPSASLLQIEWNNLESGLYLLKIEVGQKFKTFKIQKT